MAPSEHFHTIEEWDAIRPIFTRLYQEERKKLDDVRKVLEYRFNFTTTVKQCKTKIREWNLGKYKKQRELLHAKRLFNEGRRRGKHVEIRLRGDAVTLDDIAKHFKRKATELDDLDSMIPTSPTPQELVWTSRSRSNSPEVEEINPFHLPDSALQNSDYPPSAFLPHDRARFISQAVVRASTHNGLGNGLCNGPGDGHSCSHGEPCACIPRGMIMGSTERGFFNLRDLVEADFGNISIRHTYPDWWKHLDRIVVDFDDAQFHHVAGRQGLAVRSYDRVLESVTRYTQLPSMALLQLVSYLLSWAAVPVSGDVVKVLFSFLEGLKNEKRTHPALAAILPCLLTSPEHASCSIALFQECISNYLTQQLGQNSITVLRMNLRLCRHLFAMDDQEPAWSTLRDISNLRARCKDDMVSIIEPELDQELIMTLQLFDERTRDKANLEAHMRPCTDFFADSPSDGQAESQCHSLCNFKLGLYAIAHKQAKATVICFRKVFPDHDPRVQAAKGLLNRIERIKAEIKSAGVVWPLDTELFAHNDWNTDSYCNSPPDFRPDPLHRRSSGSITSITSFDSPQELIDDFNDTLYPTFTNQSDMISVTSYPRPSHLHSTSSVSNYPIYSGLEINSPVPLAQRFSDMD